MNSTWILAQALGTEKSSGITSEPVTKEEQATAVVPNAPVAPDAKRREEIVVVPDSPAAPVAKESQGHSGYIYLYVFLVVLALVVFFVFFFGFFGGPRKVK